MSTVLHVTITGKESSQRLQKALTEGETVRVGRSTRRGWDVPWDAMISREHADFTWTGDCLRVTCLDSARNPVVYQGQQFTQARIPPREWFQIGQTTFQASNVVNGADPVDEAEDDAEASPVLEQAYSADQLREVSFRNAGLQMEILAELPDRISASHSDEDLGEMLSRLLLEAIPQAQAVAVAHYDESRLPESDADLRSFPKPLSMRLQTRDSFQGRFAPSRRMLLKCLKTRSSVLHVWGGGGDAQFTMTDGLGWAFCCPIESESSQGWCLYASGEGTERGGLVVGESELLPDLRFTQLVAQFIGSVRQVRMLQEQKTQLSSFFSPKVMESLTDRSAGVTLEPAERDITVLFCDVRGFSKKSEALQKDLLLLLKSVSAALGVMAGGIVERDGAVADFQGDAALGFWGWPVEPPDGPLPACRSALQIYRKFRESFGQQEDLLFGFSIGMGIAHGRALAGRIGTNHQAKVGVFGPVVNQGSRLEGLTKQFGVPICIDENTAEFVGRLLPVHEGRLRKLARVRPKGMDTAITVTALLPPEDEQPELTAEMIAASDAVVELVISGTWTPVLPILKRLPEDDGLRNFLQSHMAETGNRPPPDWDGAFSLTSK